MKPDPEKRPGCPPARHEFLCQIGPVPDAMLDDAALEEMLLAPILEPFLRRERKPDPE